MNESLQTGVAGGHPGFAQGLVRRRSFEIPPDRSGSSAAIARFARRLGTAGGQRHNIAALALTFILVPILTLAGLPMLAIAVLGFGGVYYATAVTTEAVCPAFARWVHGPPGPPHHPEVGPSEIESADLRGVYAAVLEAHEAIRRGLKASGRIRSALSGLYERCGDVVDIAGRTARAGDSLDRHLEATGAAPLADEIGRLEARAAAAVDPQARRTYEQAAESRLREQETHRQLHGLRERIMARLEAIHALLERIGAFAIKLHALDLEQVALAADPAGGKLESLGDDLDLLDGAIAETMAD